MGFESHRAELLARKRAAKLRTLEAVGLFGVGVAKTLVPVRSGNTRNSINHQVIESKDEVQIGTPVETAVYVEKGTGEFAIDGNGRNTPWIYRDEETGQFVTTSGQKPQPFIRPIENRKAEIKEIVRRNMNV